MEEVGGEGMVQQGCRECSAVQCGQCRGGRPTTTASRGSSSHRRRERR